MIEDHPGKDLYHTDHQCYVKSIEYEILVVRDDDKLPKEAEEGERIAAGEGQPKNAA